MKKTVRSLVAVVSITIALTIVPSCRKAKESVKSDLEEAGYQLTADDWFRASRGNDVAALKKFASGNFPFDTRDAAGDSALHAAAGAGAQASADWLLDRGLHVDLRGRSGRTPLMAAVMKDQVGMVRWLLRQGADPQLQDQDGFRALMLAVREGKSSSVAELAAYSREDLDPALLLAALVGRAEVMDSLTDFGASVYTRMEDGRTPLMIAAENGHVECVKLLLELGAGRLTTGPDGQTAADFATAAGHLEIAAWINRPSLPADMSLDSPIEIAEAMDAFVDAATGDLPQPLAEVDGSSPSSQNSIQKSRAISRPIAGEALSTPVANGATFAMPPLVMRHFREKEIPLTVHTVQGEVATLHLAGPVTGELKVRAGDKIPGSSLVVLRVRRQLEDSKVSLGRPTEISVIAVHDTVTGTTREWISGLPSHAHDPVALVEDAATGKRYLASPGQRFKSETGTEYLVSDVRPNQIVIQEVATGLVRTIPLQGPRG